MHAPRPAAALRRPHGARRSRFGDGEKISARARSCAALDELVAGARRCYPADPAARARVEEAEQWGDEVLAAGARGGCAGPRLRRSPQAMDELRRRLEAAGCRSPCCALAPSSTRVERRLNKAAPSRRARRPRGAARAPRPGRRLDRRRRARRRAANAADLQIAPSVRLLLTIGDVRPLLAGAPRPTLALRLSRGTADRLPAGALPVYWLPSSGRPGARRTPWPGRARASALASGRRRAS